MHRPFDSSCKSLNQDWFGENPSVFVVKIAKKSIAIASGTSTVSTITPGGVFSVTKPGVNAWLNALPEYSIAYIAHAKGISDL
jgi:hypothetical protein